MPTQREKRLTTPVSRKKCDSCCWHDLVMNQKKGCKTMNRASTLQECCKCHDPRNKPGLF